MVFVCWLKYVAIGSPHTTLEMHANRHTHYTTHTYTCCYSSLSTRIASLSEEDEATIQSGKVCSSECSIKSQLRYNPLGMQF